MADLGRYPVEYNPKVHGPYNPGTYYGKPDPLSQVKVGELGGWLSRRNFSPRAMAACVNRGFWRWNMKYLQAKKTSFAPFAQAAVSLSVIYYFLHFKSHYYSRHSKYH